MIMSGRLSPDEPVTEAALATELAVSRTPVREALLRLEADGVLVSAFARGFAVKPLDRREAAELYPILATLEGLAVRGSRRERFDLADLRGLIDRIATSPDPVRRWQLDTTFHQALVAASDNRSLSELAGRMRTTLSRYEIEYARRVGNRTQADGQHREVVDAIESGDLVQASRLIANHWYKSMATVLGWLAN